MECTLRLHHIRPLLAWDKFIPSPTTLAAGARRARLRAARGRTATSRPTAGLQGRSRRLTVLVFAFAQRLQAKGPAGHRGDQEVRREADGDLGCACGPGLEQGHLVERCEGGGAAGAGAGGEVRSHAGAWGGSRSAGQVSAFQIEAWRARALGCARSRREARRAWRWVLSGFWRAPTAAADGPSLCAESGMMTRMRRRSSTH